MWIWILILLLCVFLITVSIINSCRPSTSLNDLREKVRNKIVNGDPTSFTPTASVERLTISNYAVYVDELRQKIMFANFATMEKQVYSFSEIVECSILEDGAAIQTGGVGRAIAGSVIAGGVGAIVGASTRKTTPMIYSLSVRIITSNIQHPLYEICA